MGTLFQLPAYSLSGSIPDDYSYLDGAYGHIGWIDTRNVFEYYTLSTDSNNDAKGCLYSSSLFNTLVSQYGFPAIDSGFPYVFMGFIFSSRPLVITSTTYRHNGYASPSFNTDIVSISGNDYYAARLYSRHTIQPGSSNTFVKTGIYNVDLYDSIEQSVIDSGVRPVNYPYPITYRLTNCTAPSAPMEAAVGDSVNVSFTFPDGYGFPNPATDVYVYNNGVLVPSSYANNVLTFTMPNPS